MFSVSNSVLTNLAKLRTVSHEFCPSHRVAAASSLVQNLKFDIRLQVLAEREFWRMVKQKPLDAFVAKAWQVVQKTAFNHHKISLENLVKIATYAHFSPTDAKAAKRGRELGLTREDHHITRPAPAKPCVKQRIVEPNGVAADDKKVDESADAVHMRPTFKRADDTASGDAVCCEGEFVKGEVGVLGVVLGVLLSDFRVLSGVLAVRFRVFFRIAAT